MISTLSRSVSAPVFRAAEKAVCPRPQTSAPTDAVDFTTIDTPLKAAALPAMDPALQLGLAAGALAVMLGGLGGGSVPLVTLEVMHRTNGVESRASYEMSDQDEANPVRVSGQFAGQPLSGGLTLDMDSEQIAWVGSIGENAEEIRVEGLDEENQTVQVSCRFGSVEGRLAVSPLMGEEGPDDYRGFLVEGDLGGAAYRAETTWTLPDFNEPPADGRFQATLSTRGSVGDQAISKDYQVEARPHGRGGIVTVDGSGQVGEVAQELKATLTVIG